MNRYYFRATALIYTDAKTEGDARDNINKDVSIVLSQTLDVINTFPLVDMAPDTSNAIDLN